MSTPKDLKLLSLMTEIDATLSAGGTWCDLEKATTLAALVLGLRPKVVVELGVWRGGSAIPMAIALRGLGDGQLVAVDAWSAAVSVAGQEGVHLEWWGTTTAQAGHDQAYQTFLARLEQHRITPDRCRVVRARTDVAEVPEQIDILHHDANHGPQTVADIDRWAPAVRAGGILVIDDLDWPNGDPDPTKVRHVRRARDRAIELGFVDLYPIGTGCLMQRVRVPNVDPIV